jgi:hypothetical protein
MPINNAVGYPQYSGVINSVVRAGKILAAFYASTVCGAICNTDYEGDIAKQGDKVEIVGEPVITIRKRIKGQKIEIENLVPAVQTMYIDQADYWAFMIDSIDKYQSDHDYMANWTMVAGKQMKIATDEEVLGYVYSQVDAANTGATAGNKTASINLGSTGAPLAITKTNVRQFLTELNQVLDEQDIPDEDRYAVLPPWMTKLIKNSDYADASMRGDNTSVMVNGRLGVLDGFTIYKSNLLATTVDTHTCTEIIAGHKSAISFAAQITDEKAGDLGTEGFGSFAKGEYVYGRKVVQPTALVHAHAYQGADS